MTKPSLTGIPFVGFSVRDAQRSSEWYRGLLGLEVVREGRKDGRLVATILRDPASGIEIGIQQHAGNDGSAFSEFRTGLDHVEFAVATREELDLWLAQLDLLGVTHSGIAERPHAALITFRDPDNIQLEFYWRETDASDVMSSQP